MNSEKKTLTVFTPAYNRAHTIGRTYESLCRQTCKDFEWLIIDDGSSDNTKDVVGAFIKECADFPIRYIYQKNQGMHGAHNTAYHNIVTELNVCIDSDDWMPDDAVEKIIAFWRQNKADDLAGFVGLDVNSQTGDVIGTDFGETGERITLTEYIDRGGGGDKKLVYRTAVIKRYPDYPIFEGEKYVSLASKYFMIDQDYKILTFNEPLAIIEYQLDGSSYNMYRQYWRNPRGFIYDRLLVLSHKPKLKKRIRYIIHYISSKLIAKEGKILADSPYPILTFILMPVGVLLYSHIRYAVKVGKKMMK